MSRSKRLDGGVGKVWQVTACDAASSYGTGWIFVAAQPTAVAAARFLRRIQVPLYREAGWPIRSRRNRTGDRPMGGAMPPIRPIVSVADFGGSVSLAIRLRLASALRPPKQGQIRYVHLDRGRVAAE